jgi:hypothetical protein
MLTKTLNPVLDQGFLPLTPEHLDKIRPVYSMHKQGAACIRCLITAATYTLIAGPAQRLVWDGAFGFGTITPTR